VIDAFLGLPDGTRFVRDRVEGAVERAEALGTEMGKRILDGGGREILAVLVQPARGGRVA
jgi:hypothetical protein